MLNHSGLDDWVVNLITLKCLPGRASIAHHDSHHLLSTNNFGESFWCWDWAFGTLSKYRPKLAAVPARAGDELRVRKDEQLFA